MKFEYIIELIMHILRSEMGKKIWTQIIYLTDDFTWIVYLYRRRYHHLSYMYFILKLNARF